MPIPRRKDSETQTEPSQELTKVKGVPEELTLPVSKAGTVTYKEELETILLTPCNSDGLGATPVVWEDRTWTPTPSTRKAKAKRKVEDFGSNDCTPQMALTRVCSLDPDNWPTLPTPTVQRLVKDCLANFSLRNGETCLAWEGETGATVDDGSGCSSDQALPDSPSGDVDKGFLKSLRTDLERLKADFDALIIERDVIAAERDEVKAERDAAKAERDAIIIEHGIMRGELAEINKRRLEEIEAAALLLDAGRIRWEPSSGTPATTAATPGPGPAFACSNQKSKESTASQQGRIWSELGKKSNANQSPEHNACTVEPVGYIKVQPQINRLPTRRLIEEDELYQASAPEVSHVCNTRVAMPDFGISSRQPVSTSLSSVDGLQPNGMNLTRSVPSISPPSLALRQSLGSMNLTASVPAMNLQGPPVTNSFEQFETRSQNVVCIPTRSVRAVAPSQERGRPLRREQSPAASVSRHSSMPCRSSSPVPHNVVMEQRSLSPDGLLVHRSHYRIEWANNWQLEKQDLIQYCSGPPLLNTTPPCPPGGVQAFPRRRT